MGYIDQLPRVSSCLGIIHHLVPEAFGRGVERGGIPYKQARV